MIRWCLYWCFSSYHYQIYKHNMLGSMMAGLGLVSPLGQRAELQMPRTPGKPCILGRDLGVATRWGWNKGVTLHGQLEKWPTFGKMFFFFFLICWWSKWHEDFEPIPFCCFNWFMVLWQHCGCESWYSCCRSVGCVSLDKGGQGYGIQSLCCNGDLGEFIDKRDFNFCKPKFHALRSGSWTDETHYKSWKINKNWVIKKRINNHPSFNPCGSHLIFSCSQVTPWLILSAASLPCERSVWSYAASRPQPWISRSGRASAIACPATQCWEDNFAWTR